MFRHGVLAWLTAATAGVAGCANLSPAPPPENPAPPAANDRMMTGDRFEIATVVTADGAQLALKRRARPDGVPILLIHGLAVNGDAWDLPAVDGPDFRYRSLTSMLGECGYDVWLLNLRGHGTDYAFSTLPPGQVDCRVDDFVLYDVPAALAHVSGATGRRPFVVASSMGAMSVAGWLQGAVLQTSGDTGAAQVAADPLVAAGRQARIAGAVLVAFPAALRWPNSPIDADGRIRWADVFGGIARLDTASNYPFELLSRSALLQSAIELSGEVPLRWLRPDEKLVALRNQLPPPLAGALQTAEERLLLAGANLIGTFNGATHHRAAVILRGKRYIMEDMSAGVLRQMAKSVRARGFVSDLGDPPHVYSDHYANITAPTLLILGGRDRVANAESARAAFFDVISSPDRTIRIFDELGHGEFEAAPIASERVYPEIIAWIAEREAGCGAVGDARH